LSVGVQTAARAPLCPLFCRNPQVTSGKESLADGWGRARRRPGQPDGTEIHSNLSFIYLIYHSFWLFVVGGSTPNSCQDFGSPASRIMVTNIPVYEKVTPNNQLMHSTTKVLSSMGTVSNVKLLQGWWKRIINYIHYNLY